MTHDDLHKTWIPHLRGQFERARPILFTGAGFQETPKTFWERLCQSGMS